MGEGADTLLSMRHPVRRDLEQQKRKRAPSGSPGPLAVTRTGGGDILRPTCRFSPPPSRKEEGGIGTKDRRGGGGLTRGIRSSHRRTGQNTKGVGAAVRVVQKRVRGLLSCKPDL